MSRGDDSSTRNNITRNDPKRVIRVILVRHGEREDEAWIEQKQFSKVVFRSAKSWVDPFLTVKGHVQARETFQALSSTSSSHGKVVIFCSPTRRTLGTAMGVTNYYHHCTSSSSNDVYVLNGLCECAGLIRLMGGSVKVSGMGWLVGASKENEERKETIYQEILLRHKKSKTITSGEQQMEDSHVQFWTPTQTDYRNPHNDDGELLLLDHHSITFEPVFRSNSKRDNDDETLNNGERKMKYKKQMDLKKSITNVTNKLSYDRYIQAVHDAVILTKMNGYDTCIIVTHREGIQNLVQHTTTNNDEKFATPYCAVASFSAKVGEENHVEWLCHNVCSYKDFKLHDIPKADEFDVQI